MRTGEAVAIKFESKTTAHPQLMLEVTFYKMLNARDPSIRFIPKVLYFGPIETYHALIMEKLGPSLLNMMRKCGGSFSITTTTQILWQLFNIMEYVHERRLLYRDVKPENFLIGLPDTDKWCTVYLIDLGFCKSYLTDDFEHIPQITNKPVAGTLRYMSISNQDGCEVSRRDDLEALMYMAVYIFKHELPWDVVKDPDIVERGRKTSMRLIDNIIYRLIFIDFILIYVIMSGAMKKQFMPEQLMSNMPLQYVQIMTMIQKLKFEERPPYRRLMALLNDVLTWLGISYREQFYDWDRFHNPIQLSLRS